MNPTNTAKEILLKEGYLSPESFVRDSALIIALSKTEKYKAECDFFRDKYEIDIEELEKALHKTKGEENFEKEEDLEDWEFALDALKWWQQKANELRASKTD